MPLNISRYSGIRLIGTLFTVVAAATALIWVYRPLLSAGFTGDDWTLLARAIQDDGPLSFLLHDHSFTYLYRPVVMTLWWISAWISGSDATGQYLLSIGLHLLNSALLFLLLRRTGLGGAISAGASVLFAIHPASAATTAWLADRFDLTASACVLGVLLVLQSPASRRITPMLALAGLTTLAIGSKETAVILLPLALFWAIFPPHPRLPRTLLAASVTFPALAFLVLRRIVLGTWGGGTLGDDAVGALQSIAEGLLGWLSHLPAQLLGLPGAISGTAGTIVAFALIGAAAWASRKASASQRKLFLGCLLLLIMAGVAQSPVSRLSLLSEHPFQITTNLRFYYLANLCLWLACAIALAALRSDSAGDDLGPKRRGISPDLMYSIAALAWCALLVHNAHAITHRWADETGNPMRLRLQEKAAETVTGIAAHPGCIVALHGTAKNVLEFPLFSDTIVKAQLPSASAASDCLVVTETVPLIALVHRSAGAAFADIPERDIGGGRRGPFASSGLLSLLPADGDRCAWQHQGRLHSFSWNGSEFVPLPASDNPLLAHCPADSAP